MKRISLLGCVLLISVACSMSQQLNTFGMYHLNRYQQCPAAAGTKPYMFVSGSYGRSWTGIEGAPSLQAVSAHKLVAERVGLGGKIFNENTGLSGKSGAEVSYAYHIPVTSGGAKLAFGLSAVLSQYSLFKDKFVLDDPDDEAIKYAENSLIVPDAAFGATFYKPNTYWLDVGIYQLLGRKVSFLNSENLDNIQIRHYIIGAGFQVTFNPNFQLEPSALFKLTEKGVFQADVGMNAVFRKMFAIGCYYRTNDAVRPFVGIDTKNVAFGYSYGFVISEIGNYSNGSHEIILCLKLNYAKSSLDNEETVVNE
ncbi:MAG: PorP/SprF family type IX secretion system membrane protein [Bacteroidetes bacterium]|nr:PorP/SprF family type IX secretion system membrane protein [Bacteroidota bacterium]